VELLKNIFIGMTIGVANVIPGVSGGTIALVLGIYEKLTDAVGNFIKNKEKRKEYFAFLIQIGMGGILGILLFSKIIDILYINYSEPMSFFFLGLIMATIPYIIKTGKEMAMTKKKIFFLVLGFVIVLALILSNGEISTNNIVENSIILTKNYVFKLFLCGILAAGAMIIPGVSGSFLLMLMGEYYNVIGFVNRREILPIIIIGSGAIIGLLLFAKWINILMNKYHSITMYFIIGLVLASTIEIYPGISFKGIFPIIDLVLCGLGFYTAYIMGEIKNKK